MSSLGSFLLPLEPIAAAAAGRGNLLSHATGLSVRRLNVDDCRRVGRSDGAVFAGFHRAATIDCAVSHLQRSHTKDCRLRQPVCRAINTDGKLGVSLTQR